MAKYPEVGTRLASLVFVRPAPSPVLEGSKRKARGVFLCDCGKAKEIDVTRVRTGTIKSCGCQQMSAARAALTKHGEGRAIGARSTEYKLWMSMRARCNTPSATGYERYGGIGVSVCDRWNDFVLFLEDMGRRPSPQHSIDRIDPYGNYEPANCRWATTYVQRHNRRGSPSQPEMQS